MISARWKSVLDITVSLLVGAAAVVVLWKALAPAKKNFYLDGKPAQAADFNVPSVPPLSLEGAAVLGSATAKVVLIQYSDFECPFCRKFGLEMLPELRKRYIDTGKVSMAFRHMPNEGAHPMAMAAAQAAECAGDEGAFWKMHDRLFQNPGRLARPELRSHASSLGLDLQRFTTCLDGQKEGAVRKDLAAAKSLAVKGTPTFFAGIRTPDSRVEIKHKIEGAQTMARFDTVLQELLALKR